MKIVDAYCIVSEVDACGVSVDSLLESMDANAVDRAVIRCDNHCAAVSNYEGNSFVGNIISKYPDVFYGFAMANPWYGEKATEEIEYWLKSGFNGVCFNPLVQGFTINDEIVFPLIDICEEYNVPVYFTTGTPMQALPFQVLSLARRYPRVNFIIGHMGANDYIGDAFASAEQAPNIYLDTSLNLTYNMRVASKTFHDKMIFGSALPRSNQNFELKKLRQAVTDDCILKKILSQNILSILGGAK